MGGDTGVVGVKVRLLPRLMPASDGRTNRGKGMTVLHSALSL